LKFTKKQIVSISDTEEHIVQTLDRVNANLIIITGGLGPTNDDLTKKTLTNYFNTRLIFHQNILDHVENLLVGRGIEVNDLNREQAMLPEAAEILPNRNGTASGMWFEKENKIIISLPGVPFEMKMLIEKEVIPRLIRSFDVDNIVHKTIMTQGIPESLLAMKIKQWEDNLPKEMKLAYLPRPGIVRLRLSISGKDEKDIKIKIEEQVKKVQEYIPEAIFGYDDVDLEKIVGDLLKEKNRTLATAESCTGGNVAKMISSVPGSSKYFLGSIVSYSNKIKIQELSILEEIIEEKGAVSEEVVRLMAQNIKEKFQSDYAIAISGIAGPDGGTEEKPVGTTWIAVASPKEIISKKYLFGEHRGRNVTRASLSALNTLRLILQNNS
jgi:nicotinamide-nucleotide amidase